MGIGSFTPHDMTPTDAGNTMYSGAVELQEAERAEIKVEAENRVRSRRRGELETVMVGRDQARLKRRMEKWRCSPQWCFPEDSSAMLRMLRDKGMLGNRSRARWATEK